MIEYYSGQNEYIFSSLDLPERTVGLHTMSLQQKGLTTKIYEPLASIQMKREETMLHAAETGFLNWNIIREITSTHAIMKTQGTTETIETHLNKTSENTHTFRGSVRERGSVSKRIAAGGALPIQGGL